MPGKRLPMRKITEVLRLDAAGMSARQIATSIGVSKTTVSDYLARAKKVGISWPLEEGLDDEVIEARLFCAPVPPAVVNRPVPDWPRLHKELKSRRHVTLRLLWLEWREVHPDGWGYSQFCFRYKQWSNTQDVVMRLSYKPGERMFVDYAGDKANVSDPDTGEAREAEVFVAALGCSGMLFCEATWSQNLPSWLGSHEHAWESFGGVSELTVPDNLRAGVSRACYYDPEINPSYAELAQHYGTVVLPARAKHPRDKAMVEAGVQSVERWVLAPLRHRTFFSLADLNAAINERVAWLNTREFRGHQSSRHDLFVDLERPALRPLPATRYEFATWKKVTANIDYHIEYERRYYSVPYQLVRQRLDVRASAGVIEIFKGTRRVASHAHEYGSRLYVTDPEHMPASHRAHLEWTPTKLRQWARGSSGATGDFVEALLSSRPHPEHAYRACLGLMSLARRYGDDRLAAACARALLVGAISYTSVKSILAEGLDRLALPDATGVPAPSTHENLRGAGYFSEEA